MRLLVLSDTHVSAGKTRKVMEAVEPFLSRVDGVLHAGDIVCPELLSALRERVPRVEAVAGNMDPDELRQELGERRVLEFAGRRVGLIHGWGAPGDLPRRAREAFLGEDKKPSVDVVVFGHSHRALFERLGDVWLLNPGSPTDRFFAPFRSLALLELGEEIQAEIVHL